MKTFAAGNVQLRIDWMQDERVGADVDGETDEQVEESDEHRLSEDEGRRQEEERQVEDDLVAGQGPEDDPGRDSVNSAAKIGGNFVQVSRRRSADLKIVKYQSIKTISLKSVLFLFLLEKIFK